MPDKEALKGGEFLIKETRATDVFIPEEFDEEQRMMAQTCRDFTETQVIPNVEKLEHHDNELLAKLLKDAGELGLLGISIPEEYDGFGQKFVTSMLTVEEMGKGYSYAVAYSAHTGIGTLPILYFGNNEQKQKYLPKLVSGEYIGAYALTEPEAGSDPNSGKSKAILSEDGKYYTLNGVKMWITNGGIADLFIVFAKINDDKNLSAFIVERNSEGLTTGAEEDKMGIRGSSTVQVFFDNVKVPAENLLGDRDGGFKIALYILNLGRIKLAGAAIGASKATIGVSVNYANERKQFGTAIANFGAIKHKLAEMAIRTFATESLTYRASQNIDDAIAALVAAGTDKGRASIEGLRQYGIEASIAKVFGSETLDFVVDEGVQIHGGMGYSAETAVERAYRDSRINRIFEGTNEINRMVVVGELLKRGMKGELDLLTPAKAVAAELMGIPDFGSTSMDYYEDKHKLIVNFKKAILMVAGAALQKFTTTLQEQQEIMMNVADMLMYTYAAESTLLRVEKLNTLFDETKHAIYKDILDVMLYDTAAKINKIGIDAVNSFAESDEQAGMLMGMKRFTKAAPVNVVAARRRIADQIIEAGKYNF
ncbi:MAG: acyl-CoA dehydrogenase family protein [Bacteroidales bacterium]|nr:acyl-CoA dehydrogenase family protein [Bacteroidales bacterium]